MKTKPKIGIMSGRLSPPKNSQIQCFSSSWESEFSLARDCGFDSIEWILDLEPNPILNSSGRSLIKSLSKQNNLEINSICCDYFMEKKLFGVSSNELEKNLQTLSDIIHACDCLEITKIEIPLIDLSSLKSDFHRSQLIDSIKKIIPLLPSDTFIVLETDLDPCDFKTFLENFDSNIIKIFLCGF